MRPHCDSITARRKRLLEDIIMEHVQGIDLKRALILVDMFGLGCYARGERNTRRAIAKMQPDPPVLKGTINKDGGKLCR